MMGNIRLALRIMLRIHALPTVDYKLNEHPHAFSNSQLMPCWILTRLIWIVDDTAILLPVASFLIHSRNTSTVLTWITSLSGYIVSIQCFWHGRWHPNPNPYLLVMFSNVTVVVTCSLDVSSFGIWYICKCYSPILVRVARYLEAGVSFYLNSACFHI